MMRALGKSVLCALISGALLVTPSISFGKAKGKAAATRGEKGGPGVSEPQTKGADGKNDPNASVEAPPDKGGKKSRAGVCQLHVDNRTNLIIKIFVDGDYVGTVSPYGDAYGYYSSGSRTVYARADFTDGSWHYWGPRDIHCFGTYTWTLSP
jgi:hypothetical protein